MKNYFWIILNLIVINLCASDTAVIPKKIVYTPYNYEVVLVFKLPNLDESIKISRFFENQKDAKELILCLNKVNNYNARHETNMVNIFKLLKPYPEELHLLMPPVMPPAKIDLPTSMYVEQIKYHKD